MKSISEFVADYDVYESKSFTLTRYERDAVCELLGYLTGNLGEERDIEKYSDYWNDSDDTTRDAFEDLYDVFSDEVTWPKVTRRVIVADVDMLRDFLTWVDGHDLWGDCEYDGRAALEKL